MKINKKTLCHKEDIMNQLPWTTINGFLFCAFCVAAIVLMAMDVSKEPKKHVKKPKRPRPTVRM